MAENADAETAQGFERSHRVESEALALKYATAGAQAVPEEELALDEHEFIVGRYLDSPYWRTKRYGHAEVRDTGVADGLSLVERIHLQGAVRRLLSDGRFIEHARSQREETADEQ